jgi:opacity protein-like surface antigen
MHSLKIKLTFLAVLLLLFNSPIVTAQSSSGEEENTREYAEPIFSTTILTIGQSTETATNGDLVFNVQHRFGTVNSGWYDFFGLDQATTRLGFQYGITDWLSIGIGRTTLEKTYDGSLKIKILRQSTGKRNMPLSLSYFGNMAINSLKWQNTEQTNYFTSRMSFVNQLLLAYKFKKIASIQLMPTFIHYNLVETAEDDHDVWSVGAGGEFRVSDKISLSAEYYYVISKQTAEDFLNPFSIGVNINTGGHVFQLYATNAAGIIEQHFIGRTTGKWTNGDIHIGFNISRSFTLKKKDYF